MFPETLFDFVLEQLAEEITLRPTPAPDPLATDSWIARSVMQKAIRRGMTALALRAAARLVVVDRRTLWRRLLTTALEDLGPGEIATTSRIVAAMRDHRWRGQMGGDWPVIAELITRACEGTRCQAANDLWNIAIRDPDLSSFKAGLCEGGMAELVAAVVDDSRDVGERGAAVLIAIGEGCGPDSPVHIQPDPGAVFEAFSASGRLGHVVTVQQEAYRLTRLPLAPLTLCLWRASAELKLTETADDDVPPAVFMDGKIPTFALDQYTRTGRAAVRSFVRSSSAWAAFASRWKLPRQCWTDAAGELLFRVEGAAVTSRRQWAAGHDLRRRSMTLGCFMPEAAVPDGFSLIRRQLPLIDHHRSAHLSTFGAD